MTQVSDPSALAEIFERDRETHLYGLADLEEPFWAASTWYLRGKAAVGLVSDGGANWITGYAMSRVDPETTLSLLVSVHEELPRGSWVTGPLGMAGAMSDLRRIESKGRHWRMILDDPESLYSGTGAVDLGPADLDAMIDLHDTDPGRAFWRTGMLQSHPFVGIWEGDLLVASAGTHVVSSRFGVAAVGGVLTRPSHRGRGFAAVVVSALCQRLWGSYPTIGLNVEVSNSTALSLYDRLGFRRAFQYEELELL